MVPCHDSLPPQIEWAADAVYQIFFTVYAWSENLLTASQGFSEKNQGWIKLASMSTGLGLTTFLITKCSRENKLGNEKAAAGEQRHFEGVL